MLDLYYKHAKLKGWFSNSYVLCIRLNGALKYFEGINSISEHDYSLTALNIHANFVLYDDFVFGIIKAANQKI